MNKLGWSISVVALALVAAGCETMQSKTAQGALAGGALGAGTGAIIGHQTGRAGEGTAIGAGLGALGGALIGHAMESNEQKAAQQQYPSPTTTTAPQANAMFCPVGGERYNSTVRYCPIHGVELKPVQ